MKRKVIKIADTTFVISLPLKWAREHKVQKGDEIDVVEKGNQLVLNLEKERYVPKKIEMDYKNFSKSAIRKSISGLYKKGYDEIKCFITDTKSMNSIQELVKDIFIGFIVSDQTKTSITVKSISNDHAEDFDNILRRIFHLNLTFGEQTIDLIKNNEYETMLSLLHMEETNNQLTNYCQRLINKGLVSNNPFFLYVIAWNSEKVADEFRYIWDYLGHKKQPVSKELLEYFKESLSYYRKYSEFYYSYSSEKVDELGKIRKHIEKKGKELFEVLDSKEVFVLNCLYSLNDVTTNFITSTVGLLQK